MIKKPSGLLLGLVIALILAAILADRLYVAGLKKEFLALEQKRIEITNRLATAKIVHENLNHVRDLVFENMDFPAQSDTVSHEAHVFAFITACVNDLKLKLVSLKPELPQAKGLITTYGYEVEIEGDFFKFGELCSKFENSRRIIALTSYNVTLVDDLEKSQGGPENKMVRVKMRLHTYRVKKS